MQKFKLTKGENYHLEKEGENLKIFYTTGGKVFFRTFNGNSLTTSQPDRACDERITLFDGATLVRDRNTISVITEEL